MHLNNCAILDQCSLILAVCGIFFLLWVSVGFCCIFEPNLNNNEISKNFAAILIWKFFCFFPSICVCPSCTDSQKQSAQSLTPARAKRGMLIRMEAFYNSSSTLWNILPQEKVLAPSYLAFRRRFFNRHITRSVVFLF